MRSRTVVVALSALALAAGTVLTASYSQANETAPPDRAGAAPPEPAAKVEQITERGTRTGRIALADASAARTVCDDGAKWLRLRFTSLALRGGDTVRLSGSAGGTYTLKAKHWNGKAFYTRAFDGGCVTVTPQFEDPGSRYAVDAYQSGSQPLTQASVTVAAAGDICGSACNQTDDLVTNMNPTAVITAGDNAYNSGSLSEYNNNYDPYWGRFNSIVHPTPGNHEYGTSGAAGYFDYFEGKGVEVGARGQGYYSYDVGDWHFIALNSNISRTSTSSQVTWLKNDLASNTKPCTAAYWHHPRWAEGNYGDDSSIAPFYQALYDAKADLIINGHDHNYQRYAPAKPDGTTDATNGVRQIIIGTGGRALYGAGSGSAADKEVSNYDTFGVGKLTLTASGYTVDFVPVAGRTFTDHVTGSCKKASTGADFGVTASPTSVSAPQGGSVQSTVTVGSSGGFNSAVNLTASGLPAGVTASLAPQAVTPPANGSANSTLTLSVSSSATPGTYPVTVTGTSGSTSRTATVQLTVTAGGSAVFSDDFESDKGWAVNPAGSDTATTGRWERGDPEQTMDQNQIAQLGTTVSGTNALSTGRLAGTGAGSHDIDGGVTSVRSPAIGLPSTSASLTFRYNFAHGNNSGTDDYLRVSVVDGGTTTQVWEKRATSGTILAGTWGSATVNLTPYAGRTVSLLVQAADNGTASLVEAQLEDVAVTGSGATPSPTASPTAPVGCAPQTNGTDVAIADLSTVESPVTVSGCSGNASSTSKVEVHIRHTYIGDLVVSLVAPDGTAYVLHNRTGSGTDDINTTYTVNLSSEVRNGTWKLRVADQEAQDTGTIDTWTLTL